MILRARPQPLFLALATALALTVALSRPAAAIVGDTPNPSGGICETNGRV
jgi:hypothetical protein